MLLTGSPAFFAVQVLVYSAKEWTARAAYNGNIFSPESGIKSLESSRVSD